MKLLLLFTFILAQSISVFSQSIETEPKLNSEDIFPSVTFLQESPNFYNDNKGYDYAFRFILTTEEIYDYVFIEKVIYGEEGGSKKIQWRKELNMDLFYEIGATGEISNVKFENWTEEGSFKMTIQEIEYEVSQLNSDKWRIKRKN